MARVRAAILAAGRGIRMGGETPKTLIPVGNGYPLLYYILQGLKAAGVESAVVVTGFEPSRIHEYIAEHGTGLDVTYVFNARYASWGNFHSVRMALDQSPGHDLLVVNSDVVVNPDLYRRVATGAGDLVLAVEERYRLDDEDMKVELDGRRVVAIGKRHPARRSHGEFVGVSLLKRPAGRLYGDVCNAWQWRGTTSGYYEDVYAEMLERVDARAVRVEQGEYAEVDLPEDMSAAARVVERFQGAWDRPQAAPA